MDHQVLQKKCLFQKLGVLLKGRLMMGWQKIIWGCYTG